MNLGDDVAKHDERSRRELGPERVLTLTDGVFAIIITILVLDLEVPDLSPGVKLIDALEADLLGDRDARLTVRGHYLARLVDLIEGARIAARMGR